VRVLSTESTTTEVRIAGGAGNDRVELGSAGSSLLDAVRSRINVSGGAGAGDSITIADGGDGRRFAVTDTRITRKVIDLPRPGDPPTIDIDSDASVEARSLFAGAGNDRVELSGAVSRTTALDGGDGADTFAIANGASLAVGLVDGGNDPDALDYSAWTGPMAIDLGAGSATGLGSGHARFEWAVGGSGGDTLTARDGSTGDRLLGRDGDDILRGGNGPDVLDGGAGGDSLDGGGGADRLSGMAGGDSLDGGAASDVLLGGLDDDTLIGGAGVDDLFGEEGNDELQSEDGEVDQDSCGDGIDSYAADPIDQVTADCETDLNEPPPPPPPPPDGGGPPAGQPGDTTDMLAPVLSSVSISNRVFRVGTPNAAARRRVAPRGTHFRFVLSEPATVTITIERRARGRRVRGRCRRTTRRNSPALHCTRFVRRGPLSTNGTVGANSVPFSGRLRGRALTRGRYRARILATDGAGNQSLEQRVSFRIVRG
jgi:hypothetical protein